MKKIFEDAKWIDATDPNLLEGGWYLVKTSSMYGWPVSACWYNQYSAEDSDSNFGGYVGWPDFGLDILGKKIIAKQCIHMLDLERILDRK